MKITCGLVSRLLSVSILLVAFGGCEQEQSYPALLGYTTGQVFQKGQIKNLRRGFFRKEVTVSVGEWTTYRPDGRLWDIWNFDEEGELVRQVQFYANGDTSAVFAYSAEGSITTQFDENGRVYYRDVVHYASSDGNLEMREITEYYETGETLRVWKQAGDAEPRSTVFTPDGKIVFDGRTDNTSIIESFEEALKSF